ncbi:hypothetical protein HY631_04475 [Candidatus Uhrbacteria bacterium]|nr:hypothetical protein [Candidatus Uhrbacteria bacterium]
MATSTSSAPAELRWAPIVVAASRSLPQSRRGVHLAVLYAAVKAECERRGRPLTPTWQAKVRQVVQRSRSFASVAKGSGNWRLVDG